MLNARIRKNWLSRGMKVGVIGERAELTYPYEYLGAGPGTLKSAAGHDFAKVLKDAKNPAIIVGQGALNRTDGGAVLKSIADLAGQLGVVRAGWNGFNVLHTAAARVGGLDLGFLPREGGLDTAGMIAAAEKGDLDVLFLLGADEIDTKRLGKAFVVYLGTHGDAGANRADVILPGAAYTEKPGVYVNTEGRVQIAERAVFPKGEAKEDWAILRALSERLGKTLPYDSLADLRAKLIADHPTFGQVDYAPAHGALDLGKLGASGDMTNDMFTSTVNDFYLTNPIARASVTMAECSAARSGSRVLAAE